MARTAKRKVGRPALPEEQRRNRALKFRARGDMQARLQAAADKSGRSISEEIEYRLEQSFLHRPLSRRFGGRVGRRALNLAQARSLPPSPRRCGQVGIRRIDDIVELRNACRAYWSRAWLAMDFICGLPRRNCLIWQRPDAPERSLRSLTQPHSSPRLSSDPTSGDLAQVQYISCGLCLLKVGRIGPGPIDEAEIAKPGRGSEKMKGHVCEKGRLGQLYAVIDTRDPATGKRKRKWHTLEAKGKRRGADRMRRLCLRDRRPAPIWSRTRPRWRSFWNAGSKTSRRTSRRAPMSATARSRARTSPPCSAAYPVQAQARANLGCLRKGLVERHDGQGTAVAANRPAHAPGAETGPQAGRALGIAPPQPRRCRRSAQGRAARRCRSMTFRRPST